MSQEEREQRASQGAEPVGGPERREVRVRPRRRVRVRRSAEDIAAEEEALELRIRQFREALFAVTPHIFVTKMIVAINVLIFVAMWVTPGGSLLSPSVEKMVFWGANFGPYTVGGEWWRLVTSMFLHFGVIHLAFNMWVLWDIGPLVERLVGPVGFLVMYMLAGIGGSLASVLWNVDVVSAGASGAVFGVFGALMGFLALRRDTVPTEILESFRSSGFFFLAVNLLFGFSVKGIDMAAHLGGLVIGLLAGLVLSQPLRADPGLQQRRIVRNSILALVGGGALYLIAVFFLQGA